MTRTNSMLIRWRVQVRRSRAHKWVNKGLFETRAVAREAASFWRYGYFDHDYMGLRNQRVVRHEGKGKP